MDVLIMLINCLYAYKLYKFISLKWQQVLGHTVLLEDAIKVTKEAGISFHTFPLKDKERLKNWLIAMRRDDFKPTMHSRICSKHFLTTDYHPFSRYLKNTAIPSVFNFPEHLQKNHPIPRREIIKAPLPQKSVDKPPLKKIKTSPTKEEMIGKISSLKRELKTVKQKVKRKEEKITSLVENLKEKSLINNAIAENIEESFSGITLDMFKNQLKNESRYSKGGSILR